MPVLRVLHWGSRFRRFDSSGSAAFSALRRHQVGFERELRPRVLVVIALIERQAPPARQRRRCRPRRWWSPWPSGWCGGLRFAPPTARAQCTSFRLSAATELADVELGLWLSAASELVDLRGEEVAVRTEALEGPGQVRLAGGWMSWRNSASVRPGKAGPVGKEGCGTSGNTDRHLAGASPAQVGQPGGPVATPCDGSGNGRGDA